MTVQNPHDRFFRDSFGRPEIARNYVEEYLSPELLVLLNLEEMELQDGSFIDETMQEHQTDLLYKVRLTSGLITYIYFLFEHKSYPDPLVSLQLLRYMVRFWEWQIKANHPLSPIIPLVVYHGKKAWTISTEFLDLVDAPKELRPYLPDFRYHLSDFSHLSDETIRGKVWLQVSLSVLRAIFNPHLRDELADLVTLMFQLSEQRTGLEYIRTILYYLSKATDRVSWTDLQTVLLHQGTQGEKAMATIAQELMQKGIEQGIEQGKKEMATIAQELMQKGIEQGIEQGKLEEKRNIARHLLKEHSILTVSEITGLTIDEIKVLQKDNDSSGNK